MRGFLDEIRSKNSGDIQLLPFQPCFDRDDYACEITLHVLQKHPSVACIYITSNGQAGVCRAIEEAKRKGRVRVIAYDLTETNRQLLYSEKLSFVLDQMAYEQGFRPLQVLYNYLCGSIPPEKDLQYTETLIYTKYNVGDTVRPDSVHRL